MHLALTSSFPRHHAVCPDCGQLRGFATQKVAEQAREDGLAAGFVWMQQLRIVPCDCADACRCAEVAVAS